MSNYKMPSKHNESARYDVKRDRGEPRHRNMAEAREKGNAPLRDGARITGLKRYPAYQKVHATVGETTFCKHDLKKPENARNKI